MEGARGARGTVVVIDVLRAFTVSAYALAGGARECRLVAEVDEALELACRLPGAIVSAEVDGLPVPGVAISNSPTMVREADVEGRVLIQRTSAGTQAAVAAARADRLYAASLVVAAATARASRSERHEPVTLVPSGSDPEDDACATYLEAVAGGRIPDLEALLAPLRASERYARIRSGAWPGFPPSDLDLALEADRFDFAMPVRRDDLGLRISAHRA